ncbi:hypothetical protein MPSEU_000235700 [Mayamaea pseudoterrestris]|nr:hypothetical protein MPSEU_000235700 [Mayamaea pseudoterrestris]
MSSSSHIHQSIPLIDVQSWTEPNGFTESARSKVAKQVDQACRNVGFFAIKHHGIPKTTIDAAWSISKAFFDLPLETKLASKTNDEATYPYGYENSECLIEGRRRHQSHDQYEEGCSEDSDENRPDTKETFSLGPPEGSGMPTRRFPAHPSNFEPAMTAYYEAMERLALILMRVFAVALELPAQHFFDSYLDKHWSALRTLNYPAIDGDVDDHAATSFRIRAGEHTDYGALTILRTNGPGLQVQAKSRDGPLQWIDVPVLRDDDVFIINLGDMMQRWTNDEWKSTLHRVIAVKDDNGGSYSQRQSMAYFCNVHGNALVSPLSTCCRDDQPAKYEPILAKDHLMAKHLASMGYKAGLSGNDDSK